MFDLIIRSGTVIDGTGEPPRTADVAICDGKVARVGKVTQRARRLIDADGALVTPGFVDIHTHYDGQASWDSRLQPSSEHGVTTVVMGNCGVGFAPVRRRDHAQLIELMEGVEDIPGTALHVGLQWDWETFPDYLDAIERRPHEIDVAAQVGHGPLRLYVMGRRGADREPATAAEIKEMGRLVAEAVEAGALGFTTSRTLNHKTSKGEPTPTLTASRDELAGIAGALRGVGGVLQVVSDFPDFDTEMETLRAMMRASGRPLSVSLSQGRTAGGHRRALAGIALANHEGLEMRAQVAARGIGVLIGLRASMNPFRESPTYRAMEPLPLDDLVHALSDGAARARVLAEVPDGPDFYARVFELGDPPDYEPALTDSIAARASRSGTMAKDLALRILLGDGGSGLLYWPILNYADGNLDAARELLADRYAIPGLSDGGAHVGTICDASFPTTLLSYWGRDRTKGPRFAPEWIVARQCRATAEAVGLMDRGVLAPGLKADLNVIDFEHLSLRKPRLAFDLPAGGKRFLQRSYGYLHTFVSGVEVADRGESTGETPGQLVRGPRF